MYWLRTTLFLFALSRLLSAGEEIESKLSGKSPEVHVQRGLVADQAMELVRQENVNALVDLGRDWPDAAAAEEDYNAALEKASVSGFDFKAGTVREALDDFCRTRDFQWRPLLEARSIMIEPKDQAHRSAAQFLQRVFVKPLAAQAGDGIGATDVQKAWLAECRTPAEKNPATETDFAVHDANVQWGVANLGALRVAAEDKRPMKSAYDFVARWLASEADRVVCLEVANRPGGSVGPSKRVELTFGRLEGKLLASPTAQVVEGLMRDSAQPDFIDNPSRRKKLCELELYRRIKMEAASAFEALAGANWIKRAADLDALGRLLIRSNAESASALILRQFDAGPYDVQLALVKSNVLLQPKSLAKGFFDLWKNLSQSDDPVFKHEADGALKWYEAHDTDPAPAQRNK